MVFKSRRKKQQQTDRLPMGDAIKTYVDVLHRRRKPMSVEARATLDRLEESFNTALNAYEVEVTLACKFVPGETFSDLGEGDEMSSMVEQMKDGAKKDCCGAKKRKPVVLGKRRRVK